MKLQERYNKEIRKKLMTDLGIKNVMAVPKVEKVVLNVGLGKGLTEAAFVETVDSTLTRITGQKPVDAKSKKSISNFKIREGQVIGKKVTLRGKRMYDFLDKLINVTLPRVKDFRGLNSSNIDKNGNLNIGFSEHLAFPEISPEEIERVHGVQVTVTTNAGSRANGLKLLTEFGFPFKK